MNNEQIKDLIEAGLDGAEAIVDGDGRHFRAVVVWSGFEGMTPVKQHQQVYASLGDAMQGAIHALSIEAHTPESWERASKLRFS